MDTPARAIDAHVHLFEQVDLDRIASHAPYALPEPFPLKAYLDGLLRRGVAQALINNVHLSILPDSDNVLASFGQLDSLKKHDPARYAGFELIGTLVARPDYATAERLADPRVKGVRIVLHDRVLDDLAPDAFSTPDFAALWTRLRGDQHVHVYAQHPAVNLAVLQQLPADLPLVIDHLGTCKPGAEDDDHAALLAAAKARGKVWFKGPGYRTATDVADVEGYVHSIAQALGPEALVMSASDAPHVGLDAAGRPYAEQFSPQSARTFSLELGACLGSDFSEALDEQRFMNLLTTHLRTL